jgi:hypothetical protein
MAHCSSTAGGLVVCMEAVCDLEAAKKEREIMIKLRESKLKSSRDMIRKWLKKYDPLTKLFRFKEVIDLFINCFKLKFSLKILKGDELPLMIFAWAGLVIFQFSSSITLWLYTDMMSLPFIRHSLMQNEFYLHIGLIYITPILTIRLIARRVKYRFVCSMTFVLFYILLWASNVLLMTWSEDYVQIVEGSLVWAIERSLQNIRKLILQLSQLLLGILKVKIIEVMTGLDQYLSLGTIVSMFFTFTALSTIPLDPRIKLSELFHH